jgi:polysaccharide pyruvyl transferase WcaK-like protein
MGCNALTYGILEILVEVARRLAVDFEYYLVGNPPDGIVPIELKSYQIHLVERVPNFGVRNILRRLWRHSLQTELQLKHLFREIDVFLDNGWGDSFSDIYGQERFNEVVQNLDFALRTGKPLILLPQTIGPFENAGLHKQVRMVLNSAAAIYARDPTSSACAKQLMPGLNVFETVDTALFMPYERQDAPHNGRVIGINPSGLLWSGGYTRNNQFGLEDNYQTIVKCLIEHLLAMDDVSVILIGHDIRGPNAGNLDDDYYVCKLIQNEFPRCKVAPFFYSPVEAKSYISGLDLLIGSRMHCCIAAYSSGVPVLPLAYSRKFKGVFAEELKYPHLSELTKDSCADVISKVGNVVRQLDSIKAEMPGRIRVLCQYREEFINDLTTKLGNIFTGNMVNRR